MSTIELNEDTIQSMLNHAREFGEGNGIDMDYSDTSIKKLDALLNEFHEGYSNDPNPDEESLSGLVLMLGIYLGESLKQHKRGVVWRYGEPAAGGPATAYLQQGDNEVYPVDWIAKQLMNGKKESVLQKYQEFGKKLR